MTSGASELAAHSEAKATAAVILVVGPRGELQQQLAGVCSGGRCRLLSASNSEAALELLAEQPAAVVLVDDAGLGGGAVDLLERVLRTHPDATRILLCREVAPRRIDDAVRRGQVFGVLLPSTPPEDQLRLLQQAVDRAYVARSGSPRLVAPAAAPTARQLAQRLLLGLPGAILTLDARGRVTAANASAELILGQSAAELCGQPAAGVGVPCRQARVDEGVFTGSSALCGCKDVSPAQCWGERQQLLWSCEALCGAGGARTGCRVSLIDISDRNDLDIQIFLAKHEIESIFDSITDPTLLVDGEGIIVRANRALSQFVDKPFPAILGASCAEVLAARHGERLVSGLDAVFRSGCQSREELKLPPGRVYKLHYFPIVRAGSVRHVVVRYHDITAEKEIENRLLQAEKLASIGELSAGIAHEINNPVGFISWNINQLAGYLEEFLELHGKTRDLAQRSLKGLVSPTDAWRNCAELWDDPDLQFALEDASDIVAECNQGVERVQRIVRDLRSYSHPATTEREETDLHECLETALTIATSEIKHRCDVVRDYGDIPPVRGIPQRLTQVFINLLVNAAQAMEERGEITLRTRAAAKGVEVRVADTGCGIPQEIINKIFDPFFTTKGVGEGTGLGLYLTRSIIEEHHGRIRAESEAGRGTCFHILLPLDPDHSQPQQAEIAP